MSSLFQYLKNKRALSHLPPEFKGALEPIVEKAGDNRPNVLEEGLRAYPTFSKDPESFKSLCDVMEKAECCYNSSIFSAGANAYKALAGDREIFKALCAAAEKMEDSSDIWDVFYAGEKKYADFANDPEGFRSLCDMVGKTGAAPSSIFMVGTYAHAVLAGDRANFAALCAVAAGKSWQDACNFISCAAYDYPAFAGDREAFKALCEVAGKAKYEVLRTWEVGVKAHAAFAGDREGFKLLCENAGKAGEDAPWILREGADARLKKEALGSLEDAQRSVPDADAAVQKQSALHK